MDFDEGKKVIVLINRLNIKLCFFLLFIMFLLGGCSESSGAEKELEVLIEPQFRDQVKEAAKYMKEQTPQVSITIRELPADGEERELEIERLRTQIMAGKGPDVYLINSASDGATQMEAPLFSNPYKTMQSGALASLDRYMESDSYWEEGSYREEFLLPGKYQGQQYIIPLSCNFNILASDQEEIPVTETDTLEDWLAKAEGAADPGFEAAMYGLENISGNWFQPAADYDEGKVLFDKEAWETFGMNFLQKKLQWVESGLEDTGEGYQITDLNFATTGMPQMRSARIIPDIQGNRMAAIRCFGAVGMSSDHKEEAYRFLMLFLNDEIKSAHQEQGIGTFVDGILGTELPVQESALAARFPSLDTDSLEMVRDVFLTIDGAYFPVGVEADLYQAVMDASRLIYGPATDYEAVWREKLSAAAGKAWENYNTQVLE